MRSPTCSGARAQRNRMRSRTVCLALALVTGLAAPGLAQTSDWPLHNLDPHNTRFAPLAQIDTSNVRSLELKWSYQTPPRPARPIR